MGQVGNLRPIVNRPSGITYKCLHHLRLAAMRGGLPGRPLGPANCQSAFSPLARRPPRLRLPRNSSHQIFATQGPRPPLIARPPASSRSNQSFPPIVIATSAPLTPTLSSPYSKLVIACRHTATIYPRSPTAPADTHMPLRSFRATLTFQTNPVLFSNTPVMYSKPRHDTSKTLRLGVEKLSPISSGLLERLTRPMPLL